MTFFLGELGIRNWCFCLQDLQSFLKLGKSFLGGSGFGAGGLEEEWDVILDFLDSNDAKDAADALL